MFKYINLDKFKRIILLLDFFLYVIRFLNFFIGCRFYKDLKCFYIG